MKGCVAELVINVVNSNSNYDMHKRSHARIMRPDDTPTVTHATLLTIDNTLTN